MDSSPTLWYTVLVHHKISVFENLRSHNISLRRVQQLTKEFQEEQRADFEGKDGSGRHKSEKRIDMFL